MTNERLIEEAEKAIRDVRWNHALPHSGQGGANWTDADLARAALAVFEAAHTPTNDEREAANAAINAWNSLDSKDGLGAALHVGQRLADAVHLLLRFTKPSSGHHVDRPDDPVANDEREALEQAVLDGLNTHHAQSTMDPTLVEERVGDAVWAAGFRRSEAPEPSARATCICSNTLGWHTAECIAASPQSESAEVHAYSKGFADGSDQAHREPHGEPSDAQVMAASVVLDGQIAFDLLRAALRAAAQAEKGQSDD